MRLSKLFHARKSRKYPIKCDEKGLSLRARCFELFEQAKRPVEAAQELNMNKTTVHRYFCDWKRLGKNFELRYTYVKELFKKTAPDRDKNTELFAQAFGITKEQLETILHQPHVLRRLMTGKHYFPIQADADHKRSIALELALLIADHLVKHKGYYVDVLVALRRYMHEAMAYRQGKNAEIEDANKLMKMTHAVLAAAIENERKGRVKPDRLSEEERSALIKYGLESEMKKTELFYWVRIGGLMASGLTQEQSREKMYQDLLDKGDLKGAKMMREFQDKVHPLVKKDQMQESPHQSLPSV